MASVMSKICSWPKEEGDVRIIGGVVVSKDCWRKRGKNGKGLNRWFER